MIWAWIAALALAVMAPLGWVLLRAPRARGRAEADRALFHAQLAELDRELAEGRMDAAAHRDAVLEVQRRLLAAPAPEPAPAGSKLPLVFVLLAQLLRIEVVRGGRFFCEKFVGAATWPDEPCKACIALHLAQDVVDGGAHAALPCVF